MEIERMADILKLLGDKTRLTIMALLYEKELCVCEIVDFLKTSQPNISQHMRKLKNGGLVKEAKRGQWVYYSLDIEDKPFIREILRHVPSQKGMIQQANCEDNDCCI
ncbi:metalloregulator ArsR/SmtB family transcription factor [Paenibacillus sp. YPG26]|uniref:ArsR/SmtB family transcription factor n=1 Tax=Paenibacillus sp. YPG26 TaxID=2878915 RepID=UPI00203CF8C6|nr:metalloregulator ArsR/SmtB family transcription factor [Paenibacillus sp. YPG26]USB34947.1 metalloregulator ArsR/SmtB family transcription factor [Paenibacillus sp. YPG26]